MLASTANYLSEHSTYSRCLSKPIEKYMKDPSVDNNLKSRVSFLGMGVIAVAEAIATLAGSVLALAVYVVTFCQSKNMKSITYDLFRISCFNTLTAVASLVGSLATPKAGIWIIQEGCKECHEFFKG